MWCDGLRSNSRQSRRQARVPGRCAVRCHSSLTARVRQNSPRTPLSASNRTTQRKADVRLVSSPRAGHCLTDSLKASTWPQRKNSGTSPAFALALWQERVARRATASPGVRMPKPRRVEDATPTAAEPPVPLAPRRRTAIQRALLPLVA